MITVCSLQWPLLKTPHDGEHANVEVEVVGCGGIGRLKDRLITRTDPTGLLAYLDVETHRLWSMNPGLRQALLDRVRAVTLVQG